MKLSTSSRSYAIAFNSFLQRYNIRWIISPKTGNALFFCSDLSMAKGLPADDFLAYSGLAGNAYEIKGDQLTRLKKEYEKQWGEPLNAIDPLFLCDWDRTHAYSVQFKDARDEWVDSSFPSEMLRLSLEGIATKALQELRSMEAIF